MTPEEKREKLLKLKELAERGIDGEKENAIALLERLMEQWDIDLDELDEDALLPRSLSYETEQEQNLMYYVIRSVVEDRNAVTFWATNKSEADRYVVEATLTRFEYVSVRALFEIMWESFITSREKMSIRHKAAKEALTEEIKSLRKALKDAEKDRTSLNSTQSLERKFMLSAFISRNKLDAYRRPSTPSSQQNRSISDREFNAYCNAYGDSLSADKTNRFGAQSLPQKKETADHE